MIAIEIGPAPIQRGAEVKGRSVGRFGGGSLPRPAGRLPLAFARQCQGRHFRGQRVVQELQLLLAGVPTDTFHRQGTRLALALPENLRLKAAGAFLQHRWRLPGPTLHYRPPLGLRDGMAYQGESPPAAPPEATKTATTAPPPPQCGCAGATTPQKGRPRAFQAAQICPK